MAQRWPQMAPRWPQDGSKKAPRGPQEAPIGPQGAILGPAFGVRFWPDFGSQFRCVRFGARFWSPFLVRFGVPISVRKLPKINFAMKRLQFHSFGTTLGTSEAPGHGASFFFSPPPFSRATAIPGRSQSPRAGPHSPVSVRVGGQGEVVQQGAPPLGACAAEGGL